MDAGLRRAWGEIVTAADYEQHMASIGQAQAGAALTAELMERAAIPAGGTIAIAGAGTGQMLDFLDTGLFRPYRLVCSDLNAAFVERLRERLAARGLEAELLQDDIECTRLKAGPDLLLAVLLLEHIDWRRGVQAFGELRPAACGIVLQENPPAMTTAVTPGRRLPPSLAKAVEMGHPALVPPAALIEAMQAQGYRLLETAVREVADEKRLAGLLFRSAARP